MQHDGTLVDELADECGGARDHEGENGVRADDATRAALRILDTARIEVERGELHPSKVRAWLEERLRAVEPRVERRGRSLESIVEGWRERGRLEHVATGIVAIDEATGGGPVLGTRWIVQGAPDAGKTALGVQIVDDLARAGRVVGILAVDEEPDDIATRLAQRAGFSREECEASDPHMIDQIKGQLRELGLEVYDREWTIEGAAVDVARRAKERGAVGVLLIDSLQTVRCKREQDEDENGGRELPIAAAIDARVKAIRTCAVEHRLIVIATSEMNRAGYRNQKAAAADEVDPLASAKWSGAIEYAARVMLSLRSVPKQPGLISLEIVKNKHGPKRLKSEKDAIYLELDRDSQTLRERDAPPDDEETAEERDAKREARASAQTHADAAVVAGALARRHGLKTRDLRAACRAAAGLSHPRTDAAAAFLIEAGAVVTEDGEHGAVLHHLDGQHTPEEVLCLLKGNARNAVIIARPSVGESADLRAVVLDVAGKFPGISARRVRQEVSARTRARVTAIDRMVAELLDGGVLENRGKGSRCAYHVAEGSGPTVSQSVSRVPEPTVSRDRAGHGPEEA